MQIHGHAIVEGRASAGMLQIPSWVAETHYLPGDIIVYDNVLYVCITAHLSSLFVSDLQHWTTTVAAAPGVVVVADPPTPDLLDLDPTIPVWRQGDSITAGSIGYIYDYCDTEPGSLSRTNLREMVFKVQALYDFTVAVETMYSGPHGFVYLWLNGRYGGQHFKSGHFQILEEYYLSPGAQGNTTNLRASQIRDTNRHQLFMNRVDMAGTEGCNGRFNQVINIDWESASYGYPYPQIFNSTLLEELTQLDYPKKTFAYGATMVITHYNIPSIPVAQWALGGGSVSNQHFPYYMANASPDICEVCEASLRVNMDGTASSYYRYEVTFDPDNDRFVLEQVYPPVPPITIP